MQTLSQFDMERYIVFLENQFAVYMEIENCTNEIKELVDTSRQVGRDIGYDFCVSIRKVYEQKLTGFKRDGYITEFGVSFLALGIFRVWFRHNQWSDEEEWLTLKIF